jgi:RHS repeat-associated protein
MDFAVQNDQSWFTVSGYLRLRDGTTYRIDKSNVTWMNDRNGNTISFTYNAQNEVSQVTDQNGRTMTIQYALTGSTCTGGGPTCDQITYPGWKNDPRTVEIGYNALGNVLRPDYSLETFQQLFPNPGQYKNPNTFNRTVAYIQYPDLNKLSILYNSYGEVAEVTLPTGGMYQYDQGCIYPYPSPLQCQLSARREYSDGSTLSQTTTYQLSYGTSASASPFSTVPGPINTIITTVTSTDNLYPNANPSTTTIHSYGGSPLDELYTPGDGYNTWWQGLEFLMQSGSPSPIITATKVWQQGAPVAWCSGYACPVSNPQKTADINTLNGANLTAETDYGYDQYNNVIQKNEYDYGTSGAGPLIRATATTYLTDPNYTGSAVNLVSLPLSKMVGNGSATYSSTEFCYDGQTSQASWCNSTSNVSALENYQSITGRLTSGQTYGTAFAYRGNLTLRNQWLSTNSTWLSASAAYDIAGNTLSVTDPRLLTTTAVWSDPNNTYAFPTSITNALNQTTSWAYDYYSGKPMNSKDPNGISTAYYFADPQKMDLLSQVIRGSGTAQTSYLYTDVPNSFSVKTETDQNTLNDPNPVVTEVLYDGLGRKAQTEEYAPCGAGKGSVISVQQSYDGLGRPHAISNPYCVGAETPEYTTTAYDSLGRALSNVTADGSTSIMSYVANQTSATDPGSVTSATVTDSAGRVTSVTEAGTISTYYRYDPLNNLTAVCQGAQFLPSGLCPAPAQGRTFGYDSLSRLTSAQLPESGTTTYNYDADGNVTSKVDSSGNTTSMTYDALNRIASKSYTGIVTPDVTYCYDGNPQRNCSGLGAPSGAGLIGHLTLVYSSASSTAYNLYDTRGNVLESTQTTGGHAYPPFYYEYNLGDALTQMTFPSGRTVTWGRDVANRINSIGGTPVNGSAKIYASSVAYASQGALSQITFGNNGDNLVERHSYDVYRQQPIGVTVGTSTNPSSLLALGLSYCTGLSPGSPCTTNNGNLQSQTIAPLNVTQTYGYTESLPGGGTLALNRLAAATETVGSATNWQETFSYDNFGNRSVNTSLTNGLNLSVLAPTCTSSTTNCATEPAVDATTNRLQGSDYWFDHNGNQTLYSPFTVTYDAENRQVAISSSLNGSATYTYDGNGRRVTKTVGGTTTTYLYDATGELTAEYGSAPTPCQTCYLTADSLGSTRLVTDQNGQLVCRHDFLPFGEELTTSNRTTAAGYCVSDDISQEFTGKERDAETGLDFFEARYMSSPQGRFTSPDLLMASARSDNPQTWNRYAYAGNNPLRFTDPTGMEAEPKGAVVASTFQAVCEEGYVADSNGDGGCDPAITNPAFYALAQGVNDAGPVVNALAVATPFVPVFAFGGAAALGMSATTAVAVGTTGVGAAESPQGQQAINSIAAAANPTSVFWSGPGAQAAAEGFAAANNGVTIGMTQLGQAAANGSMTWEQASEQFARQASGAVQVFSNNPLTPFVNPLTGQANIWYSIELPTLAGNPNVTNMVFNPVPIP